MHRCWFWVCRFAPSVWTWGRTCLWVPWVRTSCWRSSPPYPETSGPYWHIHRLLDDTPYYPELDLIFSLCYWCSVCVWSCSELTCSGLTTQSTQLCTMWILITRYFWLLDYYFFLLVLVAQCCFCWYYCAFFIVLLSRWNPMCNDFHFFSTFRVGWSYFHEPDKDMSGS